jgi:hypothetical protein
MKSIHLQDSRLLWSVGGTSLDWPLKDIRCAYLFLPSGYKWNFVLPSETTYRYVDLDRIEEQAYKDLLLQLFTVGSRLGKYFHFVLKGPQGLPFVVSFKELVDKNVDLMVALRDSREARLAQQAQWLKENPSVSCHGVVFGLTGVHKNGRTMFWRDLDRLEITKVNSLITITALAYVPLKGTSSKRIIQRVSPKYTEECLAEIDFWRSRALPPEALNETRQRQVAAQDRLVSKQKQLWLIAAAVILGLVLFVMPFALFIARARPH